jgi:predicted O-methyltransferase YrrM
MVSLLNFQKPFGAKYLEIGIYGGGTIRVLNHFIPTVEYTGIDLFEDFQASADNTHDMGNFTQADVQQFLGPAVRLIKGDSQIVLPALHSVGEKFDFIFIDGNHTYAGTKVDLENSIPMLAPGAYIALHNCSAWGTPEIDAYNRVDGGPFRVCVEMKTSGDWICVYEIDRLCVFTRRNTANG